MHQSADELRELGASIVAITPQPAEQNLALVNKHGIGFDILSDPGSAYAAQLGLRFELPDDLKEVYKGLGVNLPVHNGEASWTLPMPARLVVSKDGVVRSTDVDPDYTHRPEPQKTVEDVKALRGS